MSVEGASLPLPPGWEVRDRRVGWVAFGPGRSEVTGGNLIHPSCVLAEDDELLAPPRSVVAWLLARTDLHAAVVERLRIGRARGVLVSVPEESVQALWCVGSSLSGCFGGATAYAVLDTPSGPVVVEGFGRTQRDRLAATRSLVGRLELG